MTFLTSQKKLVKPGFLFNPELVALKMWKKFLGHPGLPHIWLHGLHITSKGGCKSQSSKCCFTPWGANHDMPHLGPLVWWASCCLKGIQPGNASARASLRLGFLVGDVLGPQRLRLSWSKWQNLQGFLCGFLEQKKLETGKICCEVVLLLSAKPCWSMSYLVGDATWPGSYNINRTALPKHASLQSYPFEQRPLGWKQQRLHSPDMQWPTVENKHHYLKKNTLVWGSYNLPATFSVCPKKYGKHHHINYHHG